MGRGHGGTLTGSHRDEQHSQGGHNIDSEEIQGSTEGDEGREGWTDDLIRDITSVWNQEPRIHKFEEDGSQQDGTAAVYRGGSRIRRCVLGQLCGERINVLERWPAS